MNRRPYSHPLVPSDERLDRIVQESVEALGERLRVVMDRRFPIPAESGVDDGEAMVPRPLTEAPADLPLPPNSQDRG